MARGVQEWLDAMRSFHESLESSFSKRATAFQSKYGNKHRGRLVFGLHQSRELKVRELLPILLEFDFRHHTYLFAGQFPFRRFAILEWIFSSTLKATKRTEPSHITN